MSGQTTKVREIEAKFTKAQSSLVTQSSDFSLLSISEMVGQGIIDTAPGYQRRERWTPDKQSALIESFLLNIPVPPVYLAEEEYGQYSVIDGKQRLTAISSFLKGDFKLQNLEKFKEIEGSNFAGLPPALRNALQVRPYIRAITLLRQSDPQLKYWVFLRLNTGGDNLLPQEIRNVAYSGGFNDMLFKLAETPFLKQQLKITSEQSNPYIKMVDVEVVLRFFAMRDLWQDFSGDFKESLNTYMDQNRHPSDSELAAKSRQFSVALDNCENIWGDHAFQRYDGAGWRSQFLNPIYDCEMVAASALTRRQVEIIRSRPNRLRAVMRRLFAEDAEFISATTRGTNNLGSVRYRINAMKNALSGVLKSL
jgi:hypothetical protein